MIVSMSGAGVSLGGRPVLRDLDIELSPGDALGVTGPNGSGKTTLLRLMATLQRPDHGRVEVLGAAAGTSESYRARSQIGLVGHMPALIEELTLEENLTHLARLAGLDEHQVARVLATVGLEEAADRLVAASSSGMKRRVEIAALLMRDPKLLLFDEATSGLDQDAAGLVEAMAERTRARGGAVVMVSHDHRALTSCTSIVKLTEGRFKT